MSPLAESQAGSLCPVEVIFCGTAQAIQFINSLSKMDFEINIYSSKVNLYQIEKSIKQLKSFPHH